MKTVYSCLVLTVYCPPRLKKASDLNSVNSSKIIVESDSILIPGDYTTDLFTDLLLTFEFILHIARPIHN